MQNDHFENLILGIENVGVKTRRKLANSPKHANLSLLSKIEPNNFAEARNMRVGLMPWKNNCIKSRKNQAWELVPRPKDKNVIGIKWVFRSKLNEDGKIVRNKARLAFKGYAQVEGVDFEEIFSLVIRLESFRMFMILSSFKNFKLYQMNVK